MKEIRLCDDAELDRVLELCNKYNFGIELQSFYNPALIGDDKTGDLIAEHLIKLDDFKCGKSLHAPFWDLNLGSKNTDIKNATMKAFNYAYEVAERLGCTEIVVHNGFVPNTSFYEGWVRNATEFWKEFFLDKDDSITMMIENQCEEDSTILKMEVDSVNDPRLKVCLDIGHAHANSKMSVEDWIISLGNRIGYLHLHNNHGIVDGRPAFMNDEHHGLNNGTIDVEKIFDLLQEYAPDAIWNLECKLDEMEDSIQVLERYFN